MEKLKQKLTAEETTWEALTNTALSWVEKQDESGEKDISWEPQTKEERMMQEMLEADLAGLQEIADDDMTFDDLEAMTRVNPSVIIAIISRLFGFIKLLSHNSSGGQELHPAIALFRSSLDSFVENAKEHNNGEMP